MLKTFDNFNDLLAEVKYDRTFTGEGSATADRFPVRFVLFDNFRDCCLFVDELFKLGNVQITRIEHWMDAEYPDTMLTHKKLADKIHQVICESPTEYRVIMPFSELARFYNNKPERAEFNSLINTVKSFDTSASGYEHRQRVYIPIVGLEGKMQHFRDDSQSFIWYYQNTDRPLDYRLILTDNTTFGVQGIEDVYTLAPSVLDWLGEWQYPDLKQNILSTSHAIFSHAEYAQPDNAFTFKPCHNAYQFLTEGLRLDVDCIPYREEELTYWEQLAKRIELKDFKFDTFFCQQFGVYELENYEVFYQQWFSHKDPFMRWLLAKYYTHRFCDKGYICRVLQNLDGYSDSMFVKGLAVTIFRLENPEEYLEERIIGLRIAAKNGVELPKEIQSYIVDKIVEIEQQQGVLSAIPYLSSLSYEEKCLIIKWYAAGKIDKEQLKALYPDLYYYLQPTIAPTEQPWVLDYIQAYKEAKVCNTYTDKVKQFILEKNQNDLEHFKWSQDFLPTRTILHDRTDIIHYCWIDGLGIDWVPFIQQIVKEHELENYFVNEVQIAKAKLPSRTENNKSDIYVISGNGGVLSKIGDLDEVAHSLRPYPQFIIDDLGLVRSSIHKMLQDHPGEKIAIVSDHGISYLSQLCEGYNLKGFKSDHYGRCALLTTNSNLVKDDKYIVVPAENGKGQQIVALKHESLMAKIPDGMGCHGGATPEEELVPIIIISSQQEKAHWTATQVSFEINEANPVFVVDILGLNQNQIPVIEYDGVIYKMNQQGTRFISERLKLNKDVTNIILRVGAQTLNFKVSINLAAQEVDLFNF